MSREEKNKVEYIVMCVFLFAERLGLQVVEALSYLLRFKGTIVTLFQLDEIGGMGAETGRYLVRVILG